MAIRLWGLDALETLDTLEALENLDFKDNVTINNST